MTETTRNPSKPSVFRTTNLTLATYLIVLGHRAEMVKIGESETGYPIGAWDFENPLARVEAKKYESGVATVDPDEFHAKLTDTRRKLFDFLGIGTPKR